MAKTPLEFVRRGLHRRLRRMNARAILPTGGADHSAVLFLRSRGYRLRRIVALVRQGRSTALTHPVERAALRMLINGDVPANVWQWASDHYDQGAKARAQRDDSQEAMDRARITDWAERLNADNPELTQGEIVGLMQQTSARRTRNGRVDVANKYDAKTLRKWIREDCQQVPVSRGRLSRKRMKAAVKG